MHNQQENQHRSPPLCELLTGSSTNKPLIPFVLLVLDHMNVCRFTL